MDYGAHLPLIGFNGERFVLGDLMAYTEVADGLGFQAIAANDHLIFSRPWLDGLVALSAVLSKTGRMTLVTTVALPVVRGPVSTAKALAAIDILSGGRLIVGVGPGSSSRDYASVGIPFEERWKRLDEAVQTLRVLWLPDSGAFKGTFYSTEEITLAPIPTQQAGPPIWIGSWGSEAGLKRTARLGDGWLASAYNTTPDLFNSAWSRLREHLPLADKDPDRFPNAIATMFMYITEDRTTADRIIKDVVSPAINRPEEELRERLLIGPAGECAQKLAAYKAAGAQRVFLWPVDDELDQLALFHERVAPLVH